MSQILAIDPGPVKSYAIVWRESELFEPIVCETPDELCRLVANFASDTDGAGYLAIENIRGFGLRLGNETLDACINVGRAVECWRWAGGQTAPMLIPRKTIATHLCNTSRGGDKEIRAALVERFGTPGTKKLPGPTSGISGDLWAALAVAVYVADEMPWAKKHGGGGTA